MLSIIFSEQGWLGIVEQREVRKSDKVLVSGISEYTWDDFDSYARRNGMITENVTRRDIPKVMEMWNQFKGAL